MSPSASSRKWFGRLGLEPVTVASRELPFTLLYLAVLLDAALQRRPFDAPLLVVISATLVLSTQLVAGYGRRHHWPSPWNYVFPLVQLVSLTLFQYGVTESLELVTVVLYFVPVANLAIQPGSRGVVIAIVAAMGLTAFGAFTGLVAYRAASPGLHVLVVTGCTFVVAAWLSSTTRQLRERTAALEALRREQDVTLSRLEANRDRLEALTQRLEESRALLASVIEAATEQAIIALDEHGTIVFANPGARRLFGSAEATLLGAPVTEIFQADELRSAAVERGYGTTSADLLHVVLGEAAEGRPEHRDWVLARPDGTTVPADVTVTRRPHSDDGRPYGYLIIATDLTQRREAERLQDEFIGLVSHELRTPLASIMGYVEILRSDEGELTPDQSRSVAVIERNAQRLLRLVEDLLVSVRMVAGTFALDAGPTDAVQVVQRSVANLLPAADAAGIVLTVDAPAAVPLLSDAERLGQVVENLVSNAVKASERGATVRVTLRPLRTGSGETGVRLTVADDGPGMSAGDVAHVTERFYRADTARRLRVRGLGLGLSIVKAIVDAHGGTMSIESAPGVGTSITVDLPDVSPPPTPAPGPPTAQE